MKKMLIGLLILGSLVQADMYMAVINVEPSKGNGKAWDIGGGSPDILLKLNKKEVNFSKSCKNEYRCVMEFDSTGSSWYVEVYDKDLKTDDIIGAGTCKLDESCKIGQATVIIQKK